LEASAAPKLLRAELYVHSPDDAERLTGSGLAISNPPWGLEDELRELLPWLAETLTQSEGGWTLDWLIAARQGSHDTRLFDLSRPGGRHDARRGNAAPPAPADPPHPRPAAARGHPP